MLYFLILIIMIGWFILGVWQLGNFLLHTPMLFNHYNPAATRRFKVHGLALIFYFTTGGFLIHYDLMAEIIFLIYIFIIPIGFMIHWNILKEVLKQKVDTEDIIDDLLTF